MDKKRRNGKIFTVDMAEIVQRSKSTFLRIRSRKGKKISLSFSSLELAKRWDKKFSHLFLQEKQKEYFEKLQIISKHRSLELEDLGDLTLNTEVDRMTEVEQRISHIEQHIEIILDLLQKEKNEENQRL